MGAGPLWLRKKCVNECKTIRSTTMGYQLLGKMAQCYRLYSNFCWGMIVYSVVSKDPSFACGDEPFSTLLPRSKHVVVDL